MTTVRSTSQPIAALLSFALTDKFLVASLGKSVPLGRALFASLLGMADKVDRCDVCEGFPFYPLAAYLANLLTATIDDSTYECLWGIGRMCLANKFIAHTGLMDKADVKRVGPVGFKE